MGYQTPQNLRPRAYTLEPTVVPRDGGLVPIVGGTGGANVTGTSMNVSQDGGVANALYFRELDGRDLGRAEDSGQLGEHATYPRDEVNFRNSGL